MNAVAALCDEAAETLSNDAEVRKVVYLTFDDGPHKNTFKLLELLKEEGVPATFFLIGNELRNYPDAVRAIYAEGHAIGCHSFHHQYSVLQTTRGFQKQVDLFHAVLEEVLGHPLEVRLFRFPFGSRKTTSEVRHYANDVGYLWIDWNATNHDGNEAINRDTEQMLAAAIRSSRNKDEIVLLMHESSNRTREMLPALLQHYRDAGYTFDVLTPEIDHMIPDVLMGLPKSAKNEG